METRSEQCARDMLACALGEERGAETALAERRAAEARAAALVAELEEVAGACVSAVERHAKDRAAAVAEMLRSGDVSTLDEVPQAPLKERLQAEQRLAIAVAARAQLATEVAALTAAKNVAKQQAHECACAVLTLQAEALADEIGAHEAELFAMRTRLRGLEIASWGLAGGGEQWRRPTLLSPRALAAIHQREEPQFAGGFDPARDAARDWRKLYDALRCDDQATPRG